ncbi:MAG TPA: amidohydrolase [Steroidobacteraceae bacterium]|jgi:hypothetical protein
MRIDFVTLQAVTFFMFGLTPSLHAAEPPADTLLRNGSIYVADEHDSVAQALAIRDGKIVFVGDNAGASAYVGSSTKLIDLQGRLVLPGLIDGHMHPLEGGSVLLKCNLNYERLTVSQFQTRIQACLDRTRDQEPDQWLEVVNWFREAMIPNNAPTTRATLNALKTKRPISVMSSFGHSALVNDRALKLANINAQTPDPAGGKIAHDAGGAPTGILEDAAFHKVTDLFPQPTAADDVKAAEAALAAMRRQGITSFLDAEASPRTIAAFAGAERQGKLTARGHFAVLITPPEAGDPIKAVAKAKSVAAKFDEGEPGPQPTLTVRNIKLFLDGVITAPAQTGAMIEPYLVNGGSSETPHWIAGTNRGPAVYFPPGPLKEILQEAARAGLEPHMHADGDAAVRAGLDGIEALRQAFPERDIRAAIAHDEIVDPADFARYKKVNALPVLSYQWEKPAPDTLNGAQDYLGPSRFKYMEPSGYLGAAGARIVFGSDWPVDRLDEWFALKVAVTRENAPDAGPKYAGRLSSDPGLSLATALLGMTGNAAYELHAEKSVGSLQVGKLADLIIVDRDIFKIAPREIAQTKVLLTMVGGKPVYTSEGFSLQH